MWWQWYFVVLIIVSAIACWLWGVRLFRRERFLAGLAVMMAMPIAVVGMFWVSTLVLALIVSGL